MTLDNLERQNEEFLWIFWRFRAARHISRANCAKINRDKQEQAAYKIFSTERRFRRSKSRFSRLKEICARGHQTVPGKSRYFTIVSQSIMKTVADHHWYAAYHNKHL